MAIGAAAWIAGARHRFFDYDEIYHAHATWLIARGERPFHEFLGSHSPLLWYALAPLWRVLPDSPASLLPLRGIAATGTAVSIASMTLAWSAVRPELPVGWLLLGIAAVAFSADVLDFGLEFRPDSWSTALLFLAFYLLLTRRPGGSLLRVSTFGCLAGVAVLASPKFLLLPVLFVATDLVERARQGAHLFRAALGYTVGAALAVLIVLAVLLLARIDPILAFQMAITYQWDFATHSAFGHGLLQAVLARPFLLTLVGAGILGWCAHLAATRRPPHAYEVAVLLFLASQLAIVDRPYKQYYAPWFLLAACFVPFAGLSLERLSVRAAPWCFGLALVVSASIAWSARHSLAGDDQAHRMLGFYDRIARWSAGDAPIAAYPPLHPVVRPDVFYAWNRTTDPAGRGTEHVMRALDIPGYRERFERAYYRRELEARPPAVIVSPLDDNWTYEPEQWAALREFLAANRERYVLLDRGLVRPVWVGRDRLDAAAIEQFTSSPR
jgi:hypothetical protein